MSSVWKRFSEEKPPMRTPILVCIGDMITWCVHIGVFTSPEDNESRTFIEGYHLVQLCNARFFKDGSRFRGEYHRSEYAGEFNMARVWWMSIPEPEFT